MDGHDEDGDGDERDDEHGDTMAAAWALFDDGKIVAARAECDKILREHEAPAAFLLLAACAREEDDAPAALSFLVQATKADPQWPTPQIWTAEILAEDPDRLEEALRHATAALGNAEEEEELLDALTLKAGIEMMLEKTKAAVYTLDDLPPADVMARHPQHAIEAGHIYLDLDRAAQARTLFESVARRHPKDADAVYALGLACEAMDDEKGKQRAWSTVLKLDLALPAEGFLLSEDAVVEVAESALRELPERARALLANVPIIISELPSADDVATGLDPRLLGLFSGTPYPEDGHLGGVPQLTRIILFRRNLERIASDEATLRAEIRTTILHETGHFFGLGEDDLAQLGLQ